MSYSVSLVTIARLSVIDSTIEVPHVYTLNTVHCNTTVYCCYYVYVNLIAVMYKHDRNGAAAKRT